MVTLVVPRAVIVPCRGSAAPPGGAPGLRPPLAGTELELDPLEPAVPDAAVVVVAALALTAVDAMPPAMAPTPNKAIALPITFPGRRARRDRFSLPGTSRAGSACAGPSCIGSSCGCIVRLLSEAPVLGGNTERALFPFEGA
jgi:hypothetical protein